MVPPRAFLERRKRTRVPTHSSPGEQLRRASAHFHSTDCPSVRRSTIIKQSCGTRPNFNWPPTKSSTEASADHQRRMWRCSVNARYTKAGSTLKQNAWEMCRFPLGGMLNDRQFVCQFQVRYLPHQDRDKTYSVWDG